MVLSVQIRLGGIGTYYNNNIDKYGTEGGGKRDGSLVSNEGVSLIAAVAISYNMKMPVAKGRPYYRSTGT